MRESTGNIRTLEDIKISVDIGDCIRLRYKSLSKFQDSTKKLMFNVAMFVRNLQIHPDLNCYGLYKYTHFFNYIFVHAGF